MGQQWQLADQRIRDSFANIFTSNIVGDQSENRWYVGWMIRLAVAARQMLWSKYRALYSAMRRKPFMSSHRLTLRAITRQKCSC